MARVIHFEIHAQDTQRAVKFYSDCFDWQIKLWDGPVEYWLVTTGQNDQPGINGAIMQRRVEIDSEAVIGFVCTIDIENIDKSMETVIKNGGQVVAEKMAVPGVGWMVYCKDSEGNIFGMMQNDPNAK